MRKTFDKLTSRLTTLSKPKCLRGGKAVKPVNSNITYLLLYICVLTTLATVTAFFVKSGYLLTFDSIDSLGHWATPANKKTSVRTVYTYNKADRPLDIESIGLLRGIDKIMAICQDLCRVESFLIILIYLKKRLK